MNQKYNDFIKEGPDSILLFYIKPYFYLSNYAVIFCKKKNLSQVVAMKQYDLPDGDIKTTSLNNDTLRKININGLYLILENDFVRTIDTSVFVSHDNPLYCQFYFGNKKRIHVGYEGRVMYMLDVDFRNAYIKESNRLLGPKPRSVMQN